MKIYDNRATVLFQQIHDLGFESFSSYNSTEVPDSIEDTDDNPFLVLSNWSIVFRSKKSLVEISPEEMWIMLFYNPEIDMKYNLDEFLSLMVHYSYKELYTDVLEHSYNSDEY